MQDPKYEVLADDYTEFIDATGHHKLFRIRALRAIPAYNVKAGDTGGFVEAEKNLSHDGNCWILGDAKAFESALVLDDALLFGWAQLSGQARLCGDAQEGYEHICGNEVVGTPKPTSRPPDPNPFRP